MASETFDLVVIGTGPGGYVERSAERPVTKFERRGTRLGHEVALEERGQRLVRVEHEAVLVSAVERAREQCIEHGHRFDRGDRPRAQYRDLPLEHLVEALQSHGARRTRRHQHVVGVVQPIVATVGGQRMIEMKPGETRSF